MTVLDPWNSTITIITLIYVMIHCIASMYNNRLVKKTGVGLTPDSDLTNAIVMVSLLISVYFLNALELKVVFGTICCFLLFFLSFVVLPRNIKYYFVFKSKLRTARQEYQRSGKKSDISIPGYTSLNTLMLHTVISIYGFFAMGVCVYFAFFGGMSSPDTSVNYSTDNYMEL